MLYYTSHRYPSKYERDRQRGRKRRERGRVGIFIEQLKERRDKKWRCCLFGLQTGSRCHPCPPPGGGNHGAEQRPVESGRGAAPGKDCLCE